MASRLIFDPQRWPEAEKKPTPTLGHVALVASCMASLGIVGISKLPWVQHCLPPSVNAILNPSPPALRVAFIGNSLTYYNDLPHLVEHVLEHRLVPQGKVDVGACLRGGASLTGLWDYGCNDYDEVHIGGRDMRSTVHQLLSDPSGWDVVVLQDFTQGPARSHERHKTIRTLHQHYVPLLKQAGRRGENPPEAPLVLLYQTWGYIEPAKHSEEIGDFDAMTSLLAKGYERYSDILDEAGLQTATAKVGAAFSEVHSHAAATWHRLYQPDHFHPTALGTALAASHLVATMERHPMLKSHFAPGVFMTVPTSLITPYEQQPIPESSELNLVLALAGPDRGPGPTSVTVVLDSELLQDDSTPASSSVAAGIDAVEVGDEDQ